MYYTGIDLHKKTSFITSIDEKGKVIAKANLPNRAEAILKYFADLGGETEVVIESTCSWYWFYDLLSAEGLKVLISNPVKTKATCLFVKVPSMNRIYKASASES